MDPSTLRNMDAPEQINENSAVDDGFNLVIDCYPPPDEEQNNSFMKSLLPMKSKIIGSLQRIILIFMRRG